MTAFVDRHVGPTSDDVESMLRVIGVESVDELTATAIPAGIRVSTALALPEARTETQVLNRLRELSERNVVKVPMYGLGYHGTITPPVIRRNVLESPAWYTAYTPYQPEISQGRLEALLTFQTMVADLTGLPTSGASLIDEGTAVAEAVALARRATPKGSVCLVEETILPQSLAVLRTRMEGLGIDVVVAGEPLTDALRSHDAFCVVL
ncbi:MAG TPA: glycine dehydrogenase (aminomethyl-transferring), partial [Propionibacteriaceae bacterium]|nr:glycine dehydrogenase (aminomethyl-transferring) [Propionibacteriaceae bacterium]